MPTIPTRLSALTPRGARSVQRIVDAAARLFGREGFERASMMEVAQAAGVSKGLLHYHFQSKEHLIIETQRAILRLIYRTVEERVLRGERGLGPALDALDALWGSVRDLRGQAPFLVETMALSTREGPVREHLDAFYNEAMKLLEGGIRNVFGKDVARLVVPPERLAMLLRMALHGLIVELAMARDDADLARLDTAYRDFRGLFEQFVLVGPSAAPT